MSVIVDVHVLVPAAFNVWHVAPISDLHVEGWGWLLANRRLVSVRYA